MNFIDILLIKIEKQMVVIGVTGGDRRSLKKTFLSFSACILLEFYVLTLHFKVNCAVLSNIFTE